MTIDQKDALSGANRQLDFLARMMLAWDTEAIPFGDVEKEGVYYMVECIRNDLAKTALA